MLSCIELTPFPVSNLIPHKISCDPHSITFLNSVGKTWGNKGSFRVEDHTVLELESASEATSVSFYDVLFLEKDPSDVEQERIKSKRTRIYMLA